MFNKQWLISKDAPAYTPGADMTDSMIEYMHNKAHAYEYGGIEAFYDFDPHHVRFPFDHPEITRATEIILDAVKCGEKITIFGDYDADGVTSTAILYRFLTETCGGNVAYHLPDRFIEGYGISAMAVDKIADDGTSLIITVDNGISSPEAVARAKEIGIKIVVTDHHTIPEIIPKADAVINPHIHELGYGFEDLAGVGVTLSLICALSSKMGLGIETTFKYFPIAAIGTIGDIMPLLGTNRLIVGYGLAHLSRHPEEWPGVAKLMGIKPGTELGSIEVSYRYVPVINAAGRLGNAERALELVLSQDSAKAALILSELIEENNKRKNTEIEIEKQTKVDGSILTKDSDAIVVAVGDDWHPGVIGLVAARLLEKYNKPAFVFTTDSSHVSSDPNIKFYKGSARSVDGINVYEGLKSASDVLDHFGGHAKAAGIGISSDNFTAFISRMNDYIKSLGDIVAPVPHQKVLAMITPETVNINFASKLERFQPYGEQNEEPKFIISGLYVNNWYTCGKNKEHLKLSLSYETDQGTKTIAGMVFSGSKNIMDIPKIGEQISVIAAVKVNDFRGNVAAELTIFDVLKGDVSIEKRVPCLYNEGCESFESFTVDREILAPLYKMLSSQTDICSDELVRGFMQTATGKGFSCSLYSILTAMHIFEEAGLCERSDKNGGWKFIKPDGKVDLTVSKYYRTTVVSK